MKVLVCNLVYGNRPHNILVDNELKAGYPADYCSVNTEGIADALNEGIDHMKENGYDAIAFLANDIEEPENWLAKKVEALITYPDAGVVASSLDCARTTLINELIISNWLISKETIEKIGYFNESMFVYGPYDLEYCERVWAAGLKTYYVIDCLAIHIGGHATGNEYGYSKEEMVAKNMPIYNQLSREYSSKERSFYVKRLNDGNDK